MWGSFYSPDFSEKLLIGKWVRVCTLKKKFFHELELQTTRWTRISFLSEEEIEEILSKSSARLDLPVDKLLDLLTMWEQPSLPQLQSQEAVYPTAPTPAPALPPGLPFPDDMDALLQGRYQAPKVLLKGMKKGNGAEKEAKVAGLVNSELGKAQGGEATANAKSTKKSYPSAGESNDQSVTVRRKAENAPPELLAALPQTDTRTNAKPPLAKKNMITTYKRNSPPEIGFREPTWKPATVQEIKNAERRNAIPQAFSCTAVITSFKPQNTLKCPYYFCTRCCIFCIHKQPNIYQCSKCNTNFDSNSQLPEHILYKLVYKITLKDSSTEEQLTVFLYGQQLADLTEARLHTNPGKAVVERMYVERVLGLEIQRGRPCTLNIFSSLHPQDNKTIYQTYSKDMVQYNWQRIKRAKTNCSK
eukprot:TRINITY_DN1779_c0_g1_i1.p1 TRINITY_DN1779_c0_g1~~TRINITY_DN1779_c0_g1_i1.p1  ORF type:complete len:416 (-),score=84.15 TRINITY_DN1779_c0_g1_i1:41-1288(-)